MSQDKGVFCRRHGFYDCPICAGHEIVWEIPIVDGGKEVGLLRVASDGQTDVLGEVLLPREWLRGERAERVPAPEPIEPRVATGPPPPELTSRIEGMFTSFDALMQVPAYREAAERGRQIHEAALALAEEEGIPYGEALHQTLPPQQ